MYTPPVTPWESEMPEVGDLTPGKDKRVLVINERSEIYYMLLKIREAFVFSRGKERPKAGLITGVKS